MANSILFMRIFLIGFMGSGKTFIGRRLAQVLRVPFIDLDAYIEQRTGQRIAQLFVQIGEAGFRQIERDALQHLPKGDAVVATGGGTPCFFDNMAQMNAQGLTIFLEVPVDVLVKRLLNERAHRPLLQQLPDEQALASFVAEKLTERGKWYARAQLQVPAAGPPMDVVARICAHIDSLSC